MKPRKPKLSAVTEYLRPWSLQSRAESLPEMVMVGVETFENTNKSSKFTNQNGKIWSIILWKVLAVLVEAQRKAQKLIIPKQCYISCLGYILWSHSYLEITLLKIQLGEICGSSQAGWKISQWGERVVIWYCIIVQPSVVSTGMIGNIFLGNHVECTWPGWVRSPYNASLLHFNKLSLGRCKLDRIQPPGLGKKLKDQGL